MSRSDILLAQIIEDLELGHKIKLPDGRILKMMNEWEQIGFLQKDGEVVGNLSYDEIKSLIRKGCRVIL